LSKQIHIKYPFFSPQTYWEMPMCLSTQFKVNHLLFHLGCLEEDSRPPFWDHSWL